MAIKQGIPQLRPSDLDSQFPAAVGSTKSVINPLRDDDEVDRLERALARARRRQIVDAEAAKLVSELKPAALEEKEKEDKVTQAVKRYDVDPETGVISVNQEDGEHSYKDALLVSSSIKTKRGEYDQAINLINAMKEFQKASDGGKDEKNEKTKKGFYVKDDGTIVPDSENGDLTLSEARAISESKRALVTTSKEQFTPEKFELMKRDLQADLTASLDQSIAQIRSQLTPKEQEALFTLGEDGKTPVVNPKARMSLTEFIMLQMAQNMGKKPEGGALALYKDTEGNTLPLPDWLTIKKFQGEEKRKDDMHEAVQGLIKEGREQIPKLVEGLRNLAGSKETTESMAAGGWSGGGAAPKEIGVKPASAPCPFCHKMISFIPGVPALVRCPECLGLAYFGKPEQQKEMLDQLAQYLAPPEKKEPQLEKAPEGTPEKKEETKEGEKK